MPKDCCQAQLSEDVISAVASYLMGKLEGRDGGIRVGDGIIPIEEVRNELGAPGSDLRSRMVHAHLDGTAVIQAVDPSWD